MSHHLAPSTSGDQGTVTAWVLVVLAAYGSLWLLWIWSS